jgi:hypothetical protein
MVHAQALAHGLNILGARLDRDLSSKQGDQFRWHYRGGVVSGIHSYLKGMGYTLILRSPNGHRLLSTLLYQGDGDYVVLHTGTPGEVEVVHTNHLTPMTATVRPQARFGGSWVRWVLMPLIFIWVVLMAVPGMTRRP